MRLTADEKKQKLLSDFSEARSNLLAAAARVPTGQDERVFLGIWGIKDLLAHLIGWDHSNLEVIDAVTNGKLPAFYAQIDKDWHSYNVYLVKVYKKDAATELIKDAQASHRTLVDRLTEIPAKDLFHDYGVRYRGYKVTVARLIESETGDERVHAAQVEAFVAELL